MKSYILVQFLFVILLSPFSYGHFAVIDNEPVPNIESNLLYNVGVDSLIAFGDSKEKIDAILGLPTSESNSEEVAVYRNGLVVVYEPMTKTVTMIIAIKNFSGAIASEDYGQLFVGKSIPQVGPMQESAASFATKLFQDLEMAPTEECLMTGQCRVILGNELQRNYVIVLPSLVLLMDKETNSIVEIRLLQKKPQGSE